jgi:predicted MPP superfamily phosphohydrolase
VALPSDAMVSAFEKAGWRNAGNTRVQLRVKGVAVSFVGVDDPHIGRDRVPPPSRIRSDVHLGIAHAPYRRVLTAFHQDGVHLVLAGHTHGGQVRIPGIGAVVTNCDLDRRQARGLTIWPAPRSDRQGSQNSLWLHVSAGAGTSPYLALRFACRPEATILDLTARDKG